MIQQNQTDSNEQASQDELALALEKAKAAKTQAEAELILSVL